MQHDRERHSDTQSGESYSNWLNGRCSSNLLPQLIRLKPVRVKLRSKQLTAEFSLTVHLDRIRRPDRLKTFGNMDSLDRDPNRLFVTAVMGGKLAAKCRTGLVASVPCSARVSGNEEISAKSL